MTSRTIAILVCTALGLGLSGTALGEAPKAEPKKDEAPAAKAEEKKPAEAPKAEAKDGKPADKTSSDKNPDPVVIGLLQQAQTKLQAQPADAGGHRAKAIKSIGTAISEVYLAPPAMPDAAPAKAGSDKPTEAPKAK